MNIIGHFNNTTDNGDGSRINININNNNLIQQKSNTMESKSDTSETVSLLNPTNTRHRGGGAGAPTKPIVDVNNNKDGDIENNHVTSPSSKRTWLAEISMPITKNFMIVLSLEQIVYFALFFINIMSWYFTNGMNGISMQSYSATLHKDGELSFDDLSLTSVVTFLQLLAGAMIGIGLLVALNTLQPGNNKTSPKVFLSKMSTYNGSELFLSSLHGIGSLATNLGFVYGSASLVQILKLIEPFETLLLTKLCSAEESKMLSVSIISSMTTVTMAAIALVQQRKSTPHPAAIFFALCSGFALSSRNVFQRRWHAKQQTKTSGSSGTSTSSTTSVESGNANKLTSSNSTDSKESSSDNTSSSSSSTSSSSAQFARLQQSLLSFTQLSLQSGVMLAIMTLIQLILSGNVFRVLGGFSIFSSSNDVIAISWKVFLWHPLYNIFSMITLGFCSALTHSLLNAGKRVVAIIMAIFWFHEPFSYRTVITLLVIAIGGSWYVMAVSQKGNKSSTPLLENKILQPTICLVLLSIVYFEPLVNSLVYGS